LKEINPNQSLKSKSRLILAKQLDFINHLYQHFNNLEVYVDLIGVETTICSGELQELTATTIAAYAL